MEITQEDIKRIQECLGRIPDKRRHTGNYRYRLLDILVIGLCSVVTGRDEFEEMEELGNQRKEWFQTFLELPGGAIPREITFKRVFAMINPEELRKALQSWLEMAGEAGGRAVNIDGKTICGSADGSRSAVHVVSAWAGKRNTVLGQVKTAEKSNEITAIPQLLDTLEISGDTVTIDAMGCQTDIALKIRQKQADYILAVKKNQKTLYREIEEYFEYLECPTTREMAEDVWEGDWEKDHGRLERREIRTACDIDFLSGKAEWKDLKTIIRYRCTRIIGGERTVTDRYYLSSRDANADWFCATIRGHWAIENGLHWYLDVCFGEDDCRARVGNLAENLNVLRKIALGRLKATETKKGKKALSVKRKMYRASLDEGFLSEILFGKG